VIAAARAGFVRLVHRAGFVRLVHMLSALLVARLLLSLFVARDALIGTIGRPGLRLWHALLAAMFAALILPTFQIVFFGHRNRTSFYRPRRFLMPVNAIAGPGFRSARPNPCENPAFGPEPKSRLQVLTPASLIQSRRFLMRSKLAISALMVASMLGATAIASAQTQPAPGASSEGNVGPGATPQSKMKSGKTKTSKMKSGTTTGMSSGSSKSDSAPKDSDSK
jgi:hypothetical protein